MTFCLVMMKFHFFTFYVGIPLTNQNGKNIIMTRKKSSWQNKSCPDNTIFISHWPCCLKPLPQLQGNILIPCGGSMQWQQFQFKHSSWNRKPIIQSLNTWNNLSTLPSCVYLYITRLVISMWVRTMTHNIPMSLLCCIQWKLCFQRCLLFEVLWINNLIHNSGFKKIERHWLDCFMVLARHIFGIGKD